MAFKNSVTLKVIQLIKDNEGKIKQSDLVDKMLVNYKDRNNCRATVSTILTRLTKDGIITKTKIPNEDSGGMPMNLIKLV